MAHDVFISYASADKPLADGVCARLEAARLRCWIAPRDILPGQDWGEAILNAIEASRVVVLVFSAHANGSPHVKREVERAIHRGTAVIPFRVEQVQPSGSLAYFIGTAHWLDAVTPPIEQHIDRLAAGIGELIGHSTAGAARLKHVRLLLAEFFRPLHVRLMRDNLSWERILGVRGAEGSAERRIAESIERDHILPNHDEMVAIIETRRHLIAADQELAPVLDDYLRHIIVYKAMRASGDRSGFPLEAGAPWPEQFGPLIERRVAALEAEEKELSSHAGPAVAAAS